MSYANTHIKATKMLTNPVDKAEAEPGVEVGVAVAVGVRELL